MVDGIRFHRIDRGEDGARRFNPISRTLRRAVDYFRVYRIARGLKADLYHLHEPALIPVGVGLKLGGTRVVYDAHEDHRAIAVRVWRRRRLTGAIFYVYYTLSEWVAEHFFDQIFTATPSIARRFRRATILHNYPLAEEVNRPVTVPYTEREHRLVFAGGISLIRGAKEMVRMLRKIPDDRGVTLDLIGELTPALERELRQEAGWSQVNARGLLAREDMLETVDRGRVGLLLFHPVPNHTEALPNKLFEFMSAGLPIVVSDFPLWRDIIEDIGCGLLVDPLDTDAIAAAAIWLIDNEGAAQRMGERGREAVRTRLNWTPEGLKLRRAYDSLIGAPAHVRVAPVPRTNVG